MQVHVDERNMRGAPKLKMCLKWQKIQTETKLGRFTVSFLLLHICEEKDENDEFDFKLSLKSNNCRTEGDGSLLCLVLFIHRYIFLTINVPLFKKLRDIIKSAKVYHSLYSSTEQLQVALWTFMFLRLGLNKEKSLNTLPLQSFHLLSLPL